MRARKGILKIILSVLAITPFFIGTAQAIPTLQLDILGGTYDAATQTIVSSGSSFTLYAYLIADSSNNISDTYFISAALVPKVSTATDLGSFSINGTTVEVTDDMTYGVPPLETLLGSGTTANWDRGDLSRHGIFETYFEEYGFQFSSSDTTVAYNTQYNAGDGPSGSSGTMYYYAFNIDTSGLNAGYEIHFDLYNSAVKSRTDVDVTQFAPFSHDAESSSSVPEPGTLVLLGTGLLGLGLIRRNKRS